ncbi:AAC(3) family N-acetyltransferase [Streptomyces albidoflavus]|uniref:AAC(3) family N-acetyltransferase n=1 Tax=Streptomyces albidoflavus TaxID=1886 RepID=UPI003862D80B|nr:AAC(3) family N-acetyltransferase [Streptomyces albidoflavus]
MPSPAPVTGPLQTRASLAAALRDLGVRPGETLLAGYASCTAFHLAEYRIAGPRVRNSFAVRTPSGPRWTTVTDTSVSDEGFAELGADFERSRPVVRGTVGGATARLFPLAAAVAHAERWLPVHRPRTA